MPLGPRGVEELVAVRRPHGDGLEARAAQHHHGELLADLGPPEPGIELFLAQDLLAVDAPDDVTALEARPSRGPHGGDAGDHHAAALDGQGVEPEPGARLPAHDPALLAQLVRAPRELL